MKKYSINRVELLGKVDRCSLAEDAGEMVATLTIITDMTTRTKEGRVIHNPIWHLVKAMEDEGVNIVALSKGDIVHVEGWIAPSRYITPEGMEKTGLEIRATSITVVE